MLIGMVFKWCILRVKELKFWYTLIHKKYPPQYPVGSQNVLNFKAIYVKCLFEPKISWQSFNVY